MPNLNNDIDFGALSMDEEEFTTTSNTDESTETATSSDDDAPFDTDTSSDTEAVEVANESAIPMVDLSIEGLQEALEANDIGYISSAFNTLTNWDVINSDSEDCMEINTFGLDEEDYLDLMTAQDAIMMFAKSTFKKTINTIIKKQKEALILKLQQELEALNADIDTDEEGES